MATYSDKQVFGFLGDQATKRTVTSQVASPTGFSYPISKTINKRVIDPVKPLSKQYYFSKETGKNLVTSMLRQLFLTRPGERVMSPRYGLNLDEYVFEPLDLTTFEFMKDDIEVCVNTYVPFLEILAINIFEATPSLPSNAVNIYLTLKIRDNDLIPPFEVGVNIG